MVLHDCIVSYFLDLLSKVGHSCVDDEPFMSFTTGRQSISNLWQVVFKRLGRLVRSLDNAALPQSLSSLFGDTENIASQPFSGVDMCKKAGLIGDSVSSEITSQSMRCISCTDDNSEHSISRNPHVLKLCRDTVHTVPKVAAPVTFGIKGKGPQPSGSRYFRAPKKRE